MQINRKESLEFAIAYTQQYPVIGAITTTRTKSKREVIWQLITFQNKWKQTMPRICVYILFEKCILNMFLV